MRVWSFFARRRQRVRPAAGPATVERVSLAPGGWAAFYGSHADPAPQPARLVLAWVRRRRVSVSEVIGLVEDAGTLRLATEIPGFAAYLSADYQWHNRGPLPAPTTVQELLEDLGETLGPELARSAWLGEV